MSQPVHISQDKQRDGSLPVTKTGSHPEGSLDDRRESTVAQRKLGALIAQSPRVAAQRVQMAVIQRACLTPKDQEDKLSSFEEFSESAESGPVLAQAKAESAPNRTGMPDKLKSGIEALSGISMDGVRVHYNSDKPAQLDAHAYALGNDIHLAAGQEHHLPHEAWHVAQQAQGLVQPTTQLKEGARINDDESLEREADVMGAKALETPSQTVQRRAMPAVRPIYQLRFNEQQRGALAQIPQVAQAPDPQAAIDQLRDNTTRSAEQLVQMSAVQLSGSMPTLQEMCAVDRFSFDQLDALIARPQASSWNALAQLGPIGRSAEDIVALYQYHVGNINPTTQEIVGLERFGLPQIDALGGAMVPRGQIANWAEFGEYAQLQRSAADLLALSDIQLAGQRPTKVEIIALERFTNADINHLRAHAGLANWPALCHLAALTRTSADLIAVSALQVGGQEPSVAQLQRLEPAATAKITALQHANLPQVTTWDELVSLCLASQGAGVIISRAAAQIAGAAPTLQNLLTVDTYTNAELAAVHGLGNYASWDSFGQTMHSIQNVMLVVIQSMEAELQNDLAEVGNALGVVPTMDQYKALLVDIDSTAPDDYGQDVNRIIYADYVRDSSYNACFDGADRLARMLGSEDVHVSYASAGDATAQYPQATQLTRAQQLGTHLQQAAATHIPTLFRVHLGGHGFTLTVEHGQVYQLETLAGAGAPGTLWQGIQNGYIHTLAQAQNDLNRMTGNDVPARIAGALNFHWNAGPIAILQKSAPDVPAYDQIKDPMVVYWTASRLQDRETVVQRFAAKIQANRAAIAQKIGANLPQNGQ